MSRLDGLKKKGCLKKWPLIRSHLDPHRVRLLEFRKFFGYAGERHCSLDFRAWAERIQNHVFSATPWRPRAMTTLSRLTVVVGMDEVMGEAGEIGREIGRRASLLMASATCPG